MRYGCLVLRNCAGVWEFNEIDIKKARLVG